MLQDLERFWNTGRQQIFFTAFLCEKCPQKGIWQLYCRHGGWITPLSKFDKSGEILYTIKGVPQS
jgi:hypothetical protein